MNAVIEGFAGQLVSPKFTTQKHTMANFRPYLALATDEFFDSIDKLVPLTRDLTVQPNHHVLTLVVKLLCSLQVVLKALVSRTTPAIRCASRQAAHVRASLRGGRGLRSPGVKEIFKDERDVKGLPSRLRKIRKLLNDAQAQAREQLRSMEGV